MNDSSRYRSTAQMFQALTPKMKQDVLFYTEASLYGKQWDQPKGTGRKGRVRRGQLKGNVFTKPMFSNVSQSLQKTGVLKKGNFTVLPRKNLRYHSKSCFSKSLPPHSYRVAHKTLLKNLLLLVLLTHFLLSEQEL